MGPLEVRSWGHLDSIGSVHNAGSCLGAVANTGEGLGGVPSAGSCLDVASNDATVMNCDWNCLNLYMREGKINGEVWITNLMRFPFDFIMYESEAE